MNSIRCNLHRGRSGGFTLIELPAVSMRKRAAFTLVELMISIAIVLVLMLGINFVFGLTSRTVGTGMALSAAGRDIRNARKVMQADFDNSVSVGESPALIIQSETIAAFQNRQDELADRDYNRLDTLVQRETETLTYDVDGESAGPNNGDEVDLQAGTNNGAPSPTLVYALNHRRHRFDRISFFANNRTGDYSRQTGDQTTYVSAETSTEAWICYGPLRQISKEGGGGQSPRYAKPGVLTAPDNPNNFYASQWMLGRHVTLLKRPPYSYAGASVMNTGVDFVGMLGSHATANITHENNAKNGPYANASAWAMPESRVDMAATTLADARAALSNTGVYPYPGTWWFDADENVAVDEMNCEDITGPSYPYTLNYLFWAKPFVNKTQNSNGNFADAMANQTREAALTTPIFLRGCTQFIVEFTGDFFEQTDGEPLGTIDYDIVGVAPTQSLRTHWYGMPRDLNGDGVIDPNVDIATVAEYQNKPPPAGDKRNPRYTPTGVPLPFEANPVVNGKWIWQWGPTTGLTAPVASTVTPPMASTPGHPNYCRPSLVRITIELIDANGRLQEGQRIEFIFKLTS